MNPDNEVGGRIMVGVAGWSYPDWEGIVYPPGRGHQPDRLKYLAGFIDVIEINNTFYRPPEERTVADWRCRVEEIEGFSFTVKLWRRFTHQREDKWKPAELEDFLGRVRPLLKGGETADGVLLAQFPHSFHCTTENLAYLKELVRRIEGVSVAVELRHNSWDNPETFGMLDELGAGICSIDQPMFRDSLEPVERVTGGLGYIRLHGRNRAHWFNEKSGRDDRYNYLYSRDDLAPWVERARRMAGKIAEKGKQKGKQKGKGVYVIANNHFRGQAVSNAIMLKASLSGKRVKAPATLLEHFPDLGKHADPDAPMQETLF
jgi:uncharacterized protein YecE (DUF72 family)